MAAVHPSRPDRPSVTDLYFDYNATAPLRDAAFNAVAGALRQCGNASSVHRVGRGVRAAIESAREQLAARLGRAADGVIFTSGGTEANNLAVRGFPGRRLLVSAVEHPSVGAGPVDGIVAVDRDGIVDLAALDALLAADPQPALLAVMLANNETGVIQPIAEIARVAHRHGALLHVDAVQAFGKLDPDWDRLGADLLSLSAHKIGGPPGVGALVLADPDRAPQALIQGGGQERRHRAGTENMPAIVGFAAALEDLGDIGAETARLQALKDRLESACQAALPDMVVLGRAAPRLANTVCLALPTLAAHTLVMALDLEGIAVSAGSACSSGKVAPSAVLLAMGETALAGAAIRVSLGWGSTAQEIELFIERFVAVANRLSARHRAA
jgi:cysteine desulfurase